MKNSGPGSPLTIFHSKARISVVPVLKIFTIESGGQGIGPITRPATFKLS
jgi:hypothetical protein